MNIISGFLPKALLVSRYTCFVGVFIMLTSLLLMLGFATADTFAGSQPQNASELLSSLTPTWRVSMFLNGLAITVVALVVNAVLQISAKSSLSDGQN
jgi:chromate transport protein ChrA